MDGSMGREMRWATGIAVVLLLLSGCGPSASSPDTLSGTITVAPEFETEAPARGLLLIVARPSAPGAEGPSSEPPLAVQRIRDPKFPLTYYLSREDRLDPSGPEVRFAGPVYIQVFLDGRGVADSSDSVRLEGNYGRNPARVGDHEAHVVLRKRQEAGVPRWVSEVVALGNQRPRGRARPEEPPPERAETATSGRGVSGTIRLASDLGEAVSPGAVLFIILRQGGGPPLAVKRVSQPRFPLAYSVGEEDRMIAEEGAFEGSVDIVARLDRDGVAGPPEPGDMEGRLRGAVIGDQEVNIVIDNRFGAAEPPALGPTSGRTVTGTIQLSPELRQEVSPGAALFIILRQGRGAPLAVKRIRQPQFPLTYSVGAEDRMAARGRAFEGRVEVVARLDRDGAAGPPGPGDLEGRLEGVVIGDGAVNILIDRLY